MMSYSIGIDYGTASGRVFLINTTNGQVVSKFSETIYTWCH